MLKPSLPIAAVLVALAQSSRPVGDGDWGR
jgi:hypothetical protein